MASQVKPKIEQAGAELPSKRAVSIQLVPEIIWYSVEASRLEKALKQGLDGYIDNLQKAIVRDSGELISYQLKTWFGSSMAEIDARLLKKLANSASSPGLTAFKRTADYVKLIPHWDEISASKKSLEIVGKTINGEYSIKVKSTESKNHKCSTCKSIIGYGELNIEEDLREDGGTLENWHSNCWVSGALREVVKEHRSAKGALDKQARSVNAILKSVPKSLSGNFTISSRADYDEWLMQLVQNWKKSTNIDESFHNLYAKNFLEYAEQIADFHLTGKLSLPRARTRLSKHLKSSQVEAVLESFLNMPPNNLEYTGAVNPGRNIQEDLFENAPKEKINRIFNCNPTVFADARDVGTHLVEGTPVLMNLSETPDEDRKRIIDFASGITFALGGTIERVTPKVFLLTPPNVHLES